MSRFSTYHWILAGPVWVFVHVCYQKINWKEPTICIANVVRILRQITINQWLHESSKPTTAVAMETSIPFFSFSVCVKRCMCVLLTFYQSKSPLRPGRLLPQEFTKYAFWHSDPYFTVQTQIKHTADARVVSESWRHRFDSTPGRIQWWIYPPCDKRPVITPSHFTIMSFYTGSPVVESIKSMYPKFIVSDCDTGTRELGY